ncbi:hypothetical protein JOC86_003191 [Bacillus pakistanensis]|uniref:Uncharacterized protein n=1 Tax=Rossellomorea pakistanensis TaxID=992288 RepID=A0ABS2NFU7_9BACI|nr:hypothetical protein [Bacillus pakistanensis]MBM7586639.1 hypothetical protein [Bacillus pakistanensis]
MSTFVIILSFLAIGIAVFAIVYTLMIGRQQKVLKGELDTDIPDQVKEHAFIRNPIFLSFLIASVLILLYILYWVINYI